MGSVIPELSRTPKQPEEELAWLLSQEDIPATLYALSARSAQSMGSSPLKSRMGTANIAGLRREGALVFAGREDGHFVAYDAKTGNIMNDIDTRTAIIAAPMTYSIVGRQFISVAPTSLKNITRPASLENQTVHRDGRSTPRNQIRGYTRAPV